MAGKLINIPFKPDIEDELELLCTFDFEGERFLVAVDQEFGETVCRQWRWSIWSGPYQEMDDPSKRAEEAAQMLLSASQDDPEAYPLEGEHYEVTAIDRGGVQGFGIKRRGRSKYLTPFCMDLRTPVRLTAAVIISVIMTYIYVRTHHFSWAQVLFAGMLRADLLKLLFLIELTGTVVIFFSRREDRTLFDLVLNAFIPLNLVTAAGLAIGNSTARWIVAVFVAVTLAPRLLTLCRAMFARRGRSRRVRRAFKGIYGQAMLCALVCFAAVNIFGLRGYSYEPSKVVDEVGEELTDRYNAALNSLKRDVWEGLTAQERLDHLQAICDYECLVDLGCSTTAVRAGEMESRQLLGEYNYTTGGIMVNADHLMEDDVRDVVETVLHEVRHLYQGAVVDMFNKVEGQLDEESLRLEMFQYAASMRESMDNYTTDDILEYLSQATERDSRGWSNYRVENLYIYYIERPDDGWDVMAGGEPPLVQDGE